MKNNSSDPSLTSSYAAPKNAKKIQKGDKGYALVKKSFKNVLGEKKVQGFSEWQDSKNKKND